MWRGLAAGRDGGGGGLVRSPFDRLRANGGGLRANGLLSVRAEHFPVRAELVEALF